MSSPHIILTSKFVYYAPDNRKSMHDYGRYSTDYMARKNALNSKEYLSPSEQEELNKVDYYLHQMDDSLTLVDQFEPKIKHESELSKANLHEANKKSLAEMNSQDYGKYIGYMMRKEALAARSQTVGLTDKEEKELQRVTKAAAKYDVPTVTKDHILQGYFSSKQDTIRLKDLGSIRKRMRDAQMNQSVLWQDVISFDNNYLRQMGVFDPATGYLDEAGIRKASRAMMKELAEKEHLNHPFWTAAIHRNTDNIHIHFGIVEAANSRPMQRYKGIEEPRGNRKLSTINAMKHTFTANMFDASAMLRDLNLERNKITKDMRDAFEESVVQPNFQSELNKFVQTLPEERTKWRYGSLNKSQKQALSKLVDLALKDNQDFAKWNDMFVGYQKYYRDMYGNSKNWKRNASYKKWSDMRYRTGNALLKELREMDAKAEHFRKKLPTQDEIDPNNYAQECLDYLEQGRQEQKNQQRKRKIRTMYVHTGELEKHNEWSRLIAKRRRRKRINNQLDYQLRKAVKPLIHKQTANNIYGKMNLAFQKGFTSFDKRQALIEHEQVRQAAEAELKE